MNGAYWGLTTLDILGKLDTVDVNEVVSWVLKCQHQSGFEHSLSSHLVCLFVYVYFKSNVDTIKFYQIEDCLPDSHRIDVCA